MLTADAQVAAYESHRAMFEAFGRYRYRNSTGVIQWMLNNAFPGAYTLRGALGVLLVMF